MVTRKRQIKGQEKQAKAGQKGSKSVSSEEVPTSPSSTIEVGCADGQNAMELNSTRFCEPDQN